MIAIIIYFLMAGGFVIFAIRELYLISKLDIYTNNNGMTIEDLAIRLHTEKDWLLTLFQHESGNNPYAENPISKAFGLIQFLPSTMKSMGVSKNVLLNRTYNQQLDYIYEYLRPYRYYFKTFTNLYLAVWFPLALNKENDFVIETKTLSKELIARQNSPFDINKDKQITKGEIEEFLRRKYPQCYNTNMYHF